MRGVGRFVTGSISLSPGKFFFSILSVSVLQVLSPGESFSIVVTEASVVTGQGMATATGPGARSLSFVAFSNRYRGIVMLLAVVDDFRGLWLPPFFINVHGCADFRRRNSRLYRVGLCRGYDCCYWAGYGDVNRIRSLSFFAISNRYSGTVMLLVDVDNFRGCRYSVIVMLVDVDDFRGCRYSGIVMLVDVDNIRGWLPLFLINVHGFADFRRRNSRLYSVGLCSRYSWFWVRGLGILRVYGHLYSLTPFFKLAAEACT